MVTRILKMLCFCLVILFTGPLRAQEICTNGIDDNGNGLIDLEDTLCICYDTMTTVAPNMANLSFENVNFCPTSLSQMNAAVSWYQGTMGTSDYYNTCGFVLPAVVANGITPTDGNGFAGGLYVARFKEYLGNVLAQPLVAEETYTLSLDVAMLGISQVGNDCSIPAMSPVRVSLFGSESAGMPWNYATGCPTMQEADGPQDGTADWVWLGDVLYTPDMAWQTVSINFKPVSDIQAIMIGPPCDLPADYPEYSASLTCMPYMLYDNLSLRKLFYSTHKLDAPEILQTKTSDCLGTDYELFVNPLPNVLYSWHGPDWSLLIDIHVELDNFTENEAGAYGVFYKLGSCSSEVATVYLMVEPPVVSEPSVALPNILTPNADGVNDELDGDVLISSCGSKEYELVVWNRWGNEIFRQTQGQLPFAGNTRSGNRVPAGVYFYSIRFNGKYHKQTLTIGY